MAVRRDFYLGETPLESAQELFLSRYRTRRTLAETVRTVHAVGRVTASAVYASASSPHYNAAAMDGIAVRASDTYAASETTPVSIEIGPFARYVDTGEAMPHELNAVIMLEDLAEAAEDYAVITKPATPWQHVRPVGEDIIAHEMILPEGHEIRPVDIGALLAGGVMTVEARVRPKVCIIPTGSELAPADAPRQPGRVVEFNSHMLCSTVEEWGADAAALPAAPDDPEAIRTALAAAAGSDLVLINAGSSAGSRDYTAKVISEIGEVFVHGVAMKPGKPVILGEVDWTPVIGVPGYPVSALLATELFAMPLIRAMLGLAPIERETADATLIKQVYSATGAAEFVRVRLGKIGDRMVAAPMSRGAGLVTSMTRADGIVVVPPERQGLEAGSRVAVKLVRSRTEIESSVIITGSHDMALDVLGTYLRSSFPGASVSSAHVGSLGGLMAVMRGEAHMAGTHLIDEKTGEYNWPYIDRLAADADSKAPGIVLVNLVGRVQGLMVAPGNPKGISGIGDLARPDVTFVNRQRGAGTRVLFDIKLKQLGITPDHIGGYEREEYTHMAVASAVSSGTADCGMGILAAAKALDLEFIPVANERYDLAIREDLLGTEPVARVLAVLRNPQFRAAVEALGGYDVSSMGEFMERGTRS